MKKFLMVCSAGLSLAASSAALLFAQDADRNPQGAPGAQGGPGRGPQGGRGGGDVFFGGPGGPGGPREDMKLTKQFDKDNNGYLDKTERQAAREFLKAERAAGRGPRGFGGPGGGGPGGGPGGRGGFGPGIMFAPAIIGEADKDSDQKLSKAEFAALADAWFDKLDADKAGKLSEEQFASRIGDVLPRPQGFGPPGGGPGGGGPDGPQAGGPRLFGPGPFVALFDAADANKDRSLTRSEWKAAFAKWFEEWDGDKNGSLLQIEVREGLEKLLPRPQVGGPGGGGFGGGPGGFGRRAENRGPPKPGAKVSPADVKAYPDAKLYDPTVLRTVFIDFDEAQWEAELNDFRNTDVEVPAKLTVDGKEYPNVGIRFRGMSSQGVPEGYKRSMNVSIDLADKKQKLYGYKTLNLLNAHEDPTFLHTVLYLEACRQYLAAPMANFVKVVINGESWGVYPNAQQFNKDFVNDFFGKGDGARWKVQGSPGGRGGLEYLGDDVEPYKRRYSIKSKDDPKSWEALIKLCKTLNETPPEKLEEALKPILDVDGVLWFLALENTLVNSDGYWIRASDYCIYLDPKGVFHLVPHDANETFQPGGGPGMGGGRRGGGGGPGGGGPGGGFGGPAGPQGGSPGGPGGGPGGPGGFGGGGRGPGGGGEIDPLVGVNPPDATKPLRSKLLAAPALRERYLRNVRTIANDWLDWEKLSPVVSKYRELIEKEVEADTRKLGEGFAQAIAGEAQPAADGAPGPGGPRGRRPSLKAFVEQRRKYLLNYPEIKNLDAAPAAAAPAAAPGGAPAQGGAVKSQAAAPEKAADLFGETKVWDVHLTFTPEQFAAMEPEGGGPGGPGGPPRGGFGPGMFLGPIFAQAGDTDGDRKLSRDEFRALGERWFAVWDKQGAGKVGAEQLREGLNATFAPPPGGPGRGGPPGIMLQGREGARNGLASAIGIEFKYVHADLDFQGRAFKDVAVRYKGNGTFIQSRAGAKRSLKIDLDEFSKDYSLAGATKLNLHNGVTDASHMNEVFSHRLFRDAGVPASRCAYARVYVTVPGKYERQYLGLYSLVENVDGDFAQDRFETKKGTILKPVTPAPFTYLGDDWARYKQTYDAKNDMPADDQKRVIEFCKLVSGADDATFDAKLADYVDLDETSRFMAVTVWLSTLDSILGAGQNYYVHLHPKTKKMQFIPWDLDHSFGQFFLTGGQDQREKLSISRPWLGENRFLERLFRNEAFKKLYVARLEEFAKTVFSPERFVQQVDEVAAAIRPAVEAESAARLARFDKVVAGEPVGPEMGGFGGPPPGAGGGPGRGPGGPPGGFMPPGMPAMQPPKPIKGFVAARAQSVTDQLAGKSQGEVLQAFGAMAGGRGPGGPGGPGRGPGGPGGPGGAGAFGPGTFLATPFMEGLDKDKDKHLTRDEITAGFMKWFDTWDSDKRGVLDDQQLRDGINRAFMPQGLPGSGPGPR